MDSGAAVGRRLVDGRFELLDTLGRGGMGVVYRALDRERGVEVALKTLRGISPDSVLRFKTEFRALRDVRHPNLVELGELFESDGTWFFTMEQVRGSPFLRFVHGEGTDVESTRTFTTGSMTIRDDDATAVEAPGAARREAREQRVERAPRPRCDEGRLRLALGGLARGLSALHAAGKVHRDIKPSNILVEPNGRAVLLDFGVVAELTQSSSLDDNMLIGTASYMAPEQARGESVGPAADWYAVGVLLYQALTGAIPFSGVTREEILVLKQHLPPQSPSDLVEGIPADLDWLCKNLMAVDPAARPREADIFEVLGLDDDDPSVARIAATAGQPFVGRRAELDELERALEHSRERPVCVFVEGESGVGKSALVDRFVDLMTAIRPRLVVLRGRCHERERVAFNALDGVIDDLARYLMSRKDASVDKLVPAYVTELVAVFPALRAVPVLADRATLAARVPGTDTRARAFAALRELLATLGKRRAIVVAIDDLQWADADSMTLLDELLRPGDAPLCLIATRRPREGQAVAQLLAGAAHDLRRIELAGLDAKDAEKLARLVAQEEGADPLHALALVTESRGHPLFLRELVRHRSTTSQPVRLEDAIWSRAGKLDEPARDLLAAVAVAASPVPRHVACVAAGITDLDAERHIAVLARDHLVRVHGPRPQDAIEPFHDRVRDAINSNLGADRERALQRAIARALEAVGASAEALLARFDAAGDVERAAHYVSAAAKAALDAFAFGRAAELLQRALDATPRAAREPRIAILINLADAFANDGRTAEAAECYFEAAGLEPADTDRHFDLLRRAAERFLMAGQMERGLEVAREVLDCVDMALPSNRARILAGIVWNQLRTRTSRIRWAPRTTIDPRSLRADVCWSLGTGLAMVDSLLGVYFSTGAAKLALAYGSPLQISRALSAATIGASAMGRRERANTLLAAAQLAAEQDGTPVSAWYAGLARAAKEFVIDNDFARSLASASALEDEWFAAGRGPGWETDVAMHFVLASQQMRGEYAPLARRVAALVHHAKRKGDLFQDVTLRVRFAVRHLLDDCPDIARSDVLDALQSWLPGSDSFGNQRGWALWSRTRIAMYAGELDTLERELGDEWRRMHRSLMNRIPLMRVEGNHAYGTFLLGRALAARKRGQHSECNKLIRATISVADSHAKLPFPVAHLPQLYLRAGIAFLLGSDDLAAILRTTIDESRRLGCNPFTPFAERRLGEVLGGDEGAAMIARADADARRAGWSDPFRGAELAFPTGRFS